MRKQQKLSGLNFPAVEMREKKPEGVTTALDESSIRERALLVRFSIGRWYGSRADEDVVQEIRVAKGATGEIGTFTKRVMKKERLLAINRVTNMARKYHKIMTMPWGDSGSRLLPVELFIDYKSKMSDYEQQFRVEVEKFFKEYARYVEEEKKNLAGFWKASDYPAEATLRNNFRFGVQIDPLPDTNDLRIKLSKEQSAEIKREVEERLHESLSGTVADIYERIGEQIEKMKEKVDKTDNLKATVFDPLREVLALLPRLNILRDPKITDLAMRVQKEILSNPVSSIKDSPKLRSDVSKKASAILTSIAALQKGNNP